MGQNKDYVLYSAAFRYFVAVAEAGSIRGAARKLNVVSSAVNRQILNLEQSFNMQFFDRVGRGLQLSVAGEVLLRHAKKVLHEFDGTISELDDLGGFKRGKVTIAAVESVGDSILPQIVLAFKSEYPGVEVDVQIMSASKVTQKVVNAECHIALTFNPPEQDGLMHVETFKLPIGAVVTPRHPLAQNRECTFAQCLEYPLALPDDQLSIGKTIAGLLKQVGGDVNTVIRTNSLRFMRSLVLDTKYVAFQTRLGIEQERRAGNLVFVPITEPVLQDESLVLLVNSRHLLSLAPRKFLEHMEMTLAEYTIDFRKN